jgi:hypothetical protein
MATKYADPLSHESRFHFVDFSHKLSRPTYFIPEIEGTPYSVCVAGQDPFRLLLPLPEIFSPSFFLNLCLPFVFGDYKLTRHELELFSYHLVIFTQMSEARFDAKIFSRHVKRLYDLWKVCWHPCTLWLPDFRVSCGRADFLSVSFPRKSCAAPPCLSRRCCFSFCHPFSATCPPILHPFYLEIFGIPPLSSFLASGSGFPFRSIWHSFSYIETHFCSFFQFLIGRCLGRSKNRCPRHCLGPKRRSHNDQNGGGPQLPVSI